MLVRPHSPEAFLAFSSSPIGSSHYCNNRFLKYYSLPHFRSVTHSYNIELGPLSIEKVMIMKYLESLYDGLRYEERFTPGELSYSLQSKKLIDTHVIVSVVGRAERK